MEAHVQQAMPRHRAALLSGGQLLEHHPGFGLGRLCFLDLLASSSSRKKLHDFTASADATQLKELVKKRGGLGPKTWTPLQQLPPELVGRESIKLFCTFSQRSLTFATAISSLRL